MYYILYYNAFFFFLNDRRKEVNYFIHFMIQQQ